MITSLGDSGLPVFHAGHCDWQRPHSVQVAKSSMPFQVKSSILPRPNTWSSSRFSASSKSIGLPAASVTGSSGPSPSGTRFAPTLSGASAMCRCFEYTTMTRKARITATLASRNAVSMTSLALSPSGCSTLATVQDANAHGVSPNGNTPVLIWAPR